MTELQAELLLKQAARIEALEAEVGLWKARVNEAADIIEKLEAALREIISCWDQVPVDNSAWNVWSFRVQDIARAALAPEADK